ncbi:hypothetical protein CHH75_08240 [Paenibacillus sp. 7541]|nr:hypothetical protein CHH75_08240 [Paenibacillus sp. 7541]
MPQIDQGGGYMSTISKLPAYGTCCLVPRPGKSSASLPYSSNWSGYVLTGRKGKYSCISGEWTVPFVLPTSRSSYSSAWVGIDGYNNSSLIQTGTAHHFVNGTAQYYAWWEILPSYETRISLPVRPGDVMRAYIAKLKGSKWLIRLQNLSRGWTFKTVQSYHGPQTSAEWIVEAPTVNGSQSSLARLSPVAFVRSRVNGCNPKFTPSQRIGMLQHHRIVSLPCKPSPSGSSFVVKNQVRA